MIFENSHDEETITKYNLEKQFKLYRELGYNEGIWLDFKNLDEDKISKIQEQIKLIAESGNINAISFYGKYYDFISSLDIPEDIVFLSWFNDYYWNNLLMNSDFNKRYWTLS